MPDFVMNNMNSLDIEYQNIFQSYDLSILYKTYLLFFEVTIVAPDLQFRVERKTKKCMPSIMMCWPEALIDLVCFSITSYNNKTL